MNRRGQVSPAVLGIAAGCALIYFAGVGIYRGGKWVGHETKAVAQKIFHHPHKNPPKAK